MPFKEVRNLLRELSHFSESMDQALRESQLRPCPSDEEESRDALDHSIVLDNVLDAEVVG